MNIVHETDTLQGKASNGKAKFWKGRVLFDGLNHFTQTVAWTRNGDGVDSQPLVSTPKLITTKNAGQANERGGKDQAIAEITSAAQVKIDKGYFLEGQRPAKEETRPLPMLAHGYDKRGHEILWPAFVQPKLDGTRMLFDGRVGWSRQGKNYLPEVIEHLACPLPGGVILDGELMLDHNEFTFQDTIRAIKKYRPSVTPQLTYHVYDCVDDTRSFAERYEIIRSIVPTLTEAGFRIVLVQTEIAGSPEEIPTWHETFTGDGFEGTMIRNIHGKYTPGQRSKDLLKFKEFQDAEFTIVDVVDGVAKEVGCAIFVCETPEGKTFNVRPKGTYAERQAMYQKRASLIGQLLSVQFFSLSEDRIPRFPVGLAVRDYE